MLFDWLVNGQIIPTNPAHSVKGPKHVIEEGETPIPEPEEVRTLFASFNTTSIIDLRNRALIGVMTYTFARVNAVANLKVQNISIDFQHHTREEIVQAQQIC
jgi:integrase/recombinase XerD